MTGRHNLSEPLGSSVLSDGERDYKQSYKITTRADYLATSYISAPSGRGVSSASDAFDVVNALEPTLQHACLLRVRADWLGVRALR